MATLKITNTSRNALFMFSRNFSLCGKYLHKSDINTDMCIIGGGIVGSSVAYFIKSRMPECRIHVIERDLKVYIHLVEN